MSESEDMASQTYMHARRAVRTIVRKCVSRSDLSAVVGSLGRAGSTVLTESIASAMADSRPWRRIVPNSFRDKLIEPAWALRDTEIKAGAVYKTHDYPVVLDLPRYARLIYTFADPVDIVRSVLEQRSIRGDQWARSHFQHMKAPQFSPNDISERDTLGLEAHFDAWVNQRHLPAMLVRYESLWENIDQVSNYLGLKIRLPEFKARARRIPRGGAFDVSSAARTYSRLRAKMEQFPAVSVIQP